MPELPEVETVMRGLKPVMEGRVIAQAEARRPDLRLPLPPDFARRLEGRRVESLARRAKYILAHLDDGHVLMIHLGMTGRVSVLGPDGRSAHLGEFHDPQGPGGAGGRRHDHVVLTMAEGTRIVYSDPRRFGLMDLFPAAELPSHKLLKHLGVEPLSEALDAPYLARAFAGKSAPLKAALLDQAIIAGLGNIYVCEALHRSKLSPRRTAGSLAKAGKLSPRLGSLIGHIRAVLAEAIAAGGSTLRDYARADGSDGAFQRAFAVYDRAGKPCARPGCAGTVKRIVQANRSTFYCPACQT